MEGSPTTSLAFDLLYSPTTRRRLTESQHRHRHISSHSNNNTTKVPKTQSRRQRRLHTEISTIPPLRVFPFHLWLPALREVTISSPTVSSTSHVRQGEIIHPIIHLAGRRHIQDTSQAGLVPLTLQGEGVTPLVWWDKADGVGEDAVAEGAAGKRPEISHGCRWLALLGSLDGGIVRGKERDEGDLQPIVPDPTPWREIALKPPAPEYADHILGVRGSHRFHEFDCPVVIRRRRVFDKCAVIGLKVGLLVLGEEDGVREVVVIGDGGDGGVRDQCGAEEGERVEIPAGVLGSDHERASQEAEVHGANGQLTRRL